MSEAHERMDGSMSFRLKRFFEKESKEGETAERKQCGKPKRRGCAEPRNKGGIGEFSADERSKNEAEAEGHADEAEIFRTIFIGADVRNGGVGHAYIAAGESVESAAEIKKPQLLGQEAGCKKEVTYESPDERSDEEFFAAVAIGQGSQNGCSEKLRERIHGHQKSKGDRAIGCSPIEGNQGAAGVEHEGSQYGNHNSDSHEVEKNNSEER